MTTFPKRIFILFSTAIALLPLQGCVNPFDPELTNDNPKLTVEGTITDKPGPYVVKLTYSAAYSNSEQIFGRYPNGAKVFISDSEGITEELTYTRAGTFVTSTDGILGKVGKSYILRIELPNGKVYESVPELMPAAPPIDTLYAEYRDVQGQFLQGEFDVFLDTQDPEGTSNYYMWKWAHYNRLDYCQQYIRNFPSPPTWFARYCCTECFEIETCPGCLNIASDQLVDGRKLARVPIMTFPYDSRTSYYLQVEQYALSETAYEFWKRAGELINNSGGVFDRPPVTVRSNVFNVDDPDEQVLGYFGASAVSIKAVYFRRDNIPAFPFSSIPQYTIDPQGCQECEESNVRTGRKPSGWDNAPLY